MNKFLIIPGDDFIWNQHELIKFLVNNQNKDILLDLNGEGCSLEAIGLYRLLNLFDFKSITILSCNLIEKHDKYNVQITPRSYKYLQIPPTDYKNFHCWNKTKIFGVFYNRALWHRIGLASFLLHNYPDVTFFNFRSNPHDEDSRQLFELQKLFKYDVQSVKNFLSSIDKFPHQVEEVDSYTIVATTKEHTDQIAKFYTNFLIDIVAETFTSGDSLYITEKTVRPMLLKKPFIVMGSKNFLIYLRQMGFKTFYDYWDEDYDGFTGKEKYLKILKLIETLSNKSIYEFDAMYKSMKGILNHNYNLLIAQKYNKNISYVY